MQKNKLLYAVIILMLAALSCKEKEKKDTRVIDAEKGITKLDQDDPSFLQLKDTAQKYLPDFIKLLEKHAGDSNYMFLLKSDFADGEVHEHMWSVPFSFTGNSFRAVFSDSAYDVKGVLHGDTITIKIADVEDWVLYDNVLKTRTGYFSEKYLKGED